jgi:hypothetical protein
MNGNFTAMDAENAVGQVKISNKIELSNNDEKQLCRVLVFPP